MSRKRKTWPLDPNGRFGDMLLASALVATLFAPWYVFYPLGILSICVSLVGIRQSKRRIAEIDREMAALDEWIRRAKEPRREWTH